MRKVIISSIITLSSLQINAQDTLKEKSINSIRFVNSADKNKNGSIELLEAQFYFDTYRDNKDKNLNNDLIEDVESVVIDLISYMEGIDCTDIKQSKSSKRFIEIYYRNKFLIF